MYFDSYLFIQVPVPKLGERAVMYLWNMSNVSASFYDFSIGYWNCLESVLFLLFFIYYLLNKGNYKFTELRTIFQRKSQNS